MIRTTAAGCCGLLPKKAFKKKKEVVIKHQHIKNEKHLIILHV